jgi:hypothetical protein
LLAVLITLTLLLPLLTTKSFELSKLTASPLGEVPTMIVAMTVLVKGLMTETVLLPLVLTYTRLPSRAIVTSTGLVPTVMVLTTVWVEC